MKPCSKQKERIALAAAGLLAEESLTPLRLHLNRCEPCRRYATELAEVCEEQTNRSRARIEMDPGASGRMLAGLEEAQKVGGERTISAESKVILWFRSFRWALAAGAGLILGLVWLLQEEKSTRPLATPVATRTSVPAVPEKARNDEPSLLAYRLAVNRSWENLDELLTRHENSDFGPSGWGIGILDFGSFDDL